MTTRIRPARASDRQALRAMTIQGFEGVSIDHGIERALGPVRGLDWKSRKARHVDDDLDHPEGEVAVAEDEEGRPIGYVSMRFDRGSRVGWIPNLVVLPDARGRGLGRSLLEHALARFRAEGMSIAKIETLEQNEVGRHLYPSVGFVESARQVHFAMRLDQEPRG